jgi:hypothetical protein
MKFLKTIAILLLLLISVQSFRYNRKNLRNTLSKNGAADDTKTEDTEDDKAFAKAKKELDAKNSALNDAKEKVKTAISENDTMKAKKDASDDDKAKTVKALEDANADVTKLEKEVEEIDKKVKELKKKLDEAKEKAEKEKEDKKDDSTSKDKPKCNAKKLLEHQAKMEYLTNNLVEKAAILALDEAEVVKAKKADDDLAEKITKADGMMKIALAPEKKVTEKSLKDATDKRDKRTASNAKMTADIELNKTAAEAEAKNCPVLSEEEKVADAKAKAEAKKHFDSNTPQGYSSPDILPPGVKLPLSGDDSWSPIPKAAVDTMVKIEVTKPVKAASK